MLAVFTEEAGAARLATTAPTSSGSTAAQSAATAAASTGTPVGAIVAAVLETVGTLGGLLKGKTGHASYSAVIGPAEQFAAKIYAGLKSSQGANFETVNKSLVPAIQWRFLAKMEQVWGFSQSLNEQIYKDVQGIQGKPAPVYSLLVLFYVWVGTNLDQDAGSDTKAEYFDHLYSEIFIAGLSDAGVSLQKLAADTAGFVAATTPGQAGTVTPSKGFGAAAVGWVIGLGLVGAVIYQATRG